MSANKKGFLKDGNSKMSEENVGLIPVEDCHLINRDEENAEAFDVFLPQSLIVLIDLRLPSPTSQRTTSAGTVTFHLQTL